MANPDAQALVLRGRARLIRPSSLQTREEAQRVFEKALDIDPRSTDAKVYLALTLISNWSMGGAVRFDKIKREPKNCSVRLLNGFRT